jgi:DNA-binding transcriptional ArsR family regulator
MVKYGPEPLDRTFAALADPTRRALLARLRETRGTSVSELARPLPMSLPAVMKHLDVLAEAGLVAREKTGRTVACRLTAAPMEEAMAWLARYQRFWTQSLDRLAAFLEEETCQTIPPSPDHTPPAARPRAGAIHGTGRASRSSGGSRPRRGGSSPPGPSRRR